MPPTRLTSLLVPVLLVALFAACGGDDDPESGAGGALTIEALSVATDGRRATLSARVVLAEGELTTIVVDWGDGNRQQLMVGPAGEEIVATHAYADDGTYTVKLEAASDAGGAAFDAVAAVIEESPDARVEATGSPTPSATPTETPTPTATATLTPTATPTAEPNSPPSLMITSADTNMSLDATIVFTVEDAEGGPIEIVVDYGDGSSESLTGANGEYTATHGYETVGNYDVLVTATDDKGLPVADDAVVTTYVTIRVTLQAELESLTKCDTFSSDNEFFGLVSALGQFKNYSVSIPTGGTSTLSFGPTQTFLLGPGDSRNYFVSVTVTEDDAGLEGADDPVGSHRGPDFVIRGEFFSRSFPTREDRITDAIGSGACVVDFHYLFIARLIP